MIPMDETLRGMIHRNEDLQEIERYIRPSNQNIRQYGFQKVLNGETSLAEILRVTSQN